ncbi:MAG: hypothetical protein NZ480_09265 [Bdellovibrionaceae bacterium]|nr:hypothetical protein [Pseudobdellovibrionaceae bacterium]MDW8189738.1 hypothetical protein [Pseudobdellovibrionaceae bacterium]
MGKIIVFATILAISLIAETSVGSSRTIIYKCESANRRKLDIVIQERLYVGKFLQSFKIRHRPSNGGKVIVEDLTKSTTLMVMRGGETMLQSLYGNQKLTVTLRGTHDSTAVWGGSSPALLTCSIKWREEKDQKDQF